MACMVFYDAPYFFFFLSKFYDTNFNFKKYLYLFIFGRAVGLCCCEGFSLLVVSWGYSLAVVQGIHIAVASLSVEHGL